MGQGRSNRPSSHVPTSNRSERLPHLKGNGSNGGGSASTEDTLTFALVNVEPGVLALTSEGDGVVASKAPIGWQVVTSVGRLGDVPPRYERAVARLPSKSGIVVRIDGPRVTVRLG